jgi:heme exporter protein A
MTDGTLLSVSALAARRGGRLVFTDVSFALPRGGALVLLGRNGSGKSTLLRLLAGLGRPAGGVVAWDDVPIADDADGHRQRVAYVGALDALKPALTVAENLALGRALKGLPRDDDAIDAALDAFDLGERADLPARFLSQGQHRRAALARLVAAPSPLWLLDEPTLALDTPSIDRLGAAIAAHRDTGGCVVAATHVALPLGPHQTLRLGAE